MPVELSRLYRRIEARLEKSNTKTITPASRSAAGAQLALTDRLLYCGHDARGKQLERFGGGTIMKHQAEVGDAARHLAEYVFGELFGRADVAARFKPPTLHDIATL